MKDAGTEKKILLFGFEELAVIVAVGEAGRTFDAEPVIVPRESWGQSLGELADKGPASDGESAPPPGRMLVLCGLEKELDGLLPALASAGAGPGCLKAVLTPHNRGWNAWRLFRELEKERRTLGC